MNFTTKRKKASWRDVESSGPTKKEKKMTEDDDGEEDGEEDSAFAELKREMAERERIKAARKKELEREVALIARTRGGDKDMERTAKETGLLCFIDVEIGKKSRADEEPACGRMLIELFEEVVPRTVKNFAQLISGEKGDGLTFLGSTFHRVLPGVSCTGGDIDRGDGTGGRSVYGRDFEDENYTLKHTDAGVLTMFSKRPNSNSSQFQILFSEQPELDGRQVVFGRVLDGFAILREIEKLGQPNGTPREPVAPRLPPPLGRIDPCMPRPAPAAQQASDGRGPRVASVKDCGMLAFDGETLEKVIEKHRGILVLPKETDDPRTVARNYRNRSNYYDNSTRSALFSWTTSA